MEVKNSPPPSKTPLYIILFSDLVEVDVKFIYFLKESKTSDCGKLTNDKTTHCGMVLKSGVVFVIQADGALVDDQKPSHAGAGEAEVVGEDELAVVAIDIFQTVDAGLATLYMII